MKTFIIAIVTLSLIISVMIVNCIYLNNAMNELILLSEAIPDDVNSEVDSVAEITFMRHLWETHRFFICLTVGQKEADQVDALIIELICSQKTQDKDNFLKAKSLITEAFIKIKTAEQLSFEGIL